jgi:hypothetical protein
MQWYRLCSWEQEAASRYQRALNRKLSSANCYLNNFKSVVSARKFLLLFEGVLRTDYKPDIIERGVYSTM